MNYKSELQSNNAELEEILASVNALPDAGGGGSSGGDLPFELCQVQHSFYDGMLTVNGIEAYPDEVSNVPLGGFMNTIAIMPFEAPVSEVIVTYEAEGDDGMYTEEFPATVVPVSEYMYVAITDGLVSESVCTITVITE